MNILRNHVVQTTDFCAAKSCFHNLPTQIFKSAQKDFTEHGWTFSLCTAISVALWWALWSCKLEQNKHVSLTLQTCQGQASFCTPSGPTRQRNSTLSGRQKRAKSRRCKVEWRHEKLLSVHVKLTAGVREAIRQERRCWNCFTTLALRQAKCQSNRIFQLLFSIPNGNETNTVERSWLITASGGWQTFRLNNNFIGLQPEHEGEKRNDRRSQINWINKNFFVAAFCLAPESSNALVTVL